MSLVSELHLCEGCLVLYNGALGKKWNIGAHKLQIISYGSDHMCRQECLNTSNKWSYSVSVAASLPPSLIPGGWGSLYFRCDESDTLGRSHLNSTHCFAHRMVTLAAVWRNRARLGELVPAFSSLNPAESARMPLLWETFSSHNTALPGRLANIVQATC